MITTYRLSTLAGAMLGSAEVIEDRNIKTLLTDSRSLTFPEETLFFALVTTKGNGHNYISELYDKGVRSFVISDGIDRSLYPEASFIIVDNTLEALQRVASFHRSRLDCPVVGITGSNGKTTLKEIIYRLLHQQMTVRRSPKSYNSSIGVPLSLWGISNGADLALIEAGISRTNEMEVLEHIIQPNIGIITNIGEAHQENFKSKEEKCREKLKLFKHSQYLCYCKDDQLISRMIQESELRCSLLTWSISDPEATVYVEEIDEKEDIIELHLLIANKPYIFPIPRHDDGSIKDVLLAITLIAALYPEMLDRAEVFRTLEPLSMRLEVVEGDRDMILINDTYNSDYDSLHIALNYMIRRNTDQREMVLILSDVLENDDDPEVLYSRIAHLVNRYPLSHLFTIGKAIMPYKDKFDAPITTYTDTTTFIQDLPIEQLESKLILLKGARSARFEQIVQVLKRRTHQSILEVNLSNMVHNLNYYRSRLPIGTKIVCMVKAFGYGTGAYEIAKTLMAQRCDYLAVALVDEGKQLREHGITMPIMVMNPEPSAFPQMIEYRLQPEVYNFRLLQTLIRALEASGEQHYPIHIKWDTGMHRLGFSPSDINELTTLLKKSDAVRVASIFTHLAAADIPQEDDFTHKQIRTIKELSSQLKEIIGYDFECHALNTAGITRFSDYAMDMVRLGIGLYGIAPVESDRESLLPIASLRTVILQVRDVPAGDTIGYGCKGVVTRPSRIGVIPIGYADGISRQLGNGAITFRTHQGTMVPTIGNICMDSLMLDLTDAPEAIEGSEIIIFDEHSPIERLSDVIGTIPYEIIATLSPRIARYYFNE